MISIAIFFCKNLILVYKFLVLCYNSNLCNLYINLRKEWNNIKMDKDTKIELLKIFGMIVILVLLIFGIVYLNRAHDVSLNETNTVTEKNITE